MAKQYNFVLLSDTLSDSNFYVNPQYIYVPMCLIMKHLEI